MKKEMDRWGILHERPQTKAGIMIISNFLSRGQEMSTSVQSQSPKAIAHVVFLTLTTSPRALTFSV